MIRRILLPVLLLGLFSSFLFAQRQTGAIEGKVQDLDLQPLPGVTLTVSSPSLIGGSSITESDRNGFYRFPALASGLYEIKAELAGFQTLIRRNVDVSVGLTLTVHFSLEMTSIGEVVEVTAGPPMIDVSTTAISFTIAPEVIRNLPNFQRIDELLALTPGVGDDLIAYGADGRKANYISMDGVGIGHPRHGGLGVSYNYNWVDEVQVTGIGAPAEYGQFTGVVGNFTTRSGGNQFHGLFETFFQNENLVFSNAPDPQPDTPFQTYDISAQLGGPILKDKLWFFSGFQFPHTESQTLNYDSVSTDAQSKWITKLTYKLNQNNTLQGFAHRNDQLVEPGASLDVLPEAINTTDSSQTSWNATWISLLSTRTNLEGRFGGFRNRSDEIEDRPDLPGHFDQSTQIQSVNTAGEVDSRQDRLQWNAALSHHARNFIQGSHDFRFGVDFERSEPLTQYFINGGLSYFDYLGEPYYRVQWAGYSFEGTNHRTSVYAQDEWNISDRFNVSLGVRWDHNRGFTDRGMVFATDPVAPRIGFVWILNQNNQTVIKVHYGDYYQALLERDYYFESDSNHPQIGEIYTGEEWVEIGRFYETYLVDDELKQPYVRQFSVGIDQVLPGEIPFGAHYIYRRFGNILEDIGISQYESVPAVNPHTGEAIVIFLPQDEELKYLLTNPQGLYRRYDGIELYANKQFGGKISVSGSFVYSKLTGNSPGDVTFGGASTSFLDNPNSLINFPGKLVNDPTLAWKVFGTYELPWGFNTGWYFRHSSGDTWTPRVRVAAAGNPNIVINAEEAGSRRLPAQNLLDMRVEKQVLLYGGQLRFTMDVFNVFNNAYALRVSDRIEDPNFGTPFLYNEPRTIRLGLRYTF